MKSIVNRILVLCAAAVTLFSSCDVYSFKKGDDVQPEEVPCRNLLLVYVAGHNSLSDYLDANILDMTSSAQGGEGYVPVRNSEDVLLVMSHRPKSSGDYEQNMPAHLLRLYMVNDYKVKGSKERIDTVMVDTLRTYRDLIPTKKGAMRQILEDVDSLFHAEHYGMIFSSHGTGWVPPGYYSNPDAYESSRRPASPKVGTAAGAVPYVEDNDFPGAPAVRSVGQTRLRVDGTTYSYEFSIDDFAAEFPYRFDYIYFDACLMGGVEFAWQMRNVCDKLGVSPAEVLAQGMDYGSCVEHLLKGGKGDIESVCRSYYDIYANQTGANQSATITLVDCTAMDDLASACGELFEKYRIKMSILEHEDIQPYFRLSHQWYYDLKDILLKCNITEDEQSRLEAALDKCIIYKQATPSFLPNFGGFEIKTYSGLSMYLPCKGSAYLDNYYKTLDWNKATSLVSE